MCEPGLRGGKSRGRVDASGATDGEARDAVQHEVIGCISREVRSSLGGVDGCVAASAPQLVLLFELASSRGDGRGDAAHLCWPPFSGTFGCIASRH